MTTCSARCCRSPWPAPGCNTHWGQCSTGGRSLLDTTPLQRTAREVLNTEQLAANVADGLLASVGVAATRMPTDFQDETVRAASGRSVLFDDSSHGDYAGDPGPALDVVRRADHRRARAGLLSDPGGLPPDPHLAAPSRPPGRLVDSGVQRPATRGRVGAARMLLICRTHPPPPTARHRAPAPTGRTQDIADAAAQVLHAVLADRMVEDLATYRGE